MDFGYAITESVKLLMLGGVGWILASKGLDVLKDKVQD